MGNNAKNNKVTNEVKQEVINVGKKEYVKGFDFGRSSGRIIDKDGVISTFDSSFIEIAVGAKVRVEGDNPKNDFTIIDCPWSNIVGKRFVKGTTMDFHEGLMRKADESEFKTYQDETYVNASYALAKDIYDLIDNFAVETSNEDTETQVGVFSGLLKTGLCMPTKEFFTGDHKDIIKSNLSGEYSIKFNILGKTVKFTVDKDKVVVSPEGVVAWLLLTYSLNRETLAIIAKTNGVIIDLGHGSTDITIMRNGNPYGKKAVSAPIGGVNLNSLVADNLEAARVVNTPGNVKRVITEGVVSNGTEDVPMGRVVVKAKNELADEVVKRVKDALKNAMMSSKEISYLYFVGRSFIVVGEAPAEGDTTETNYTGSLAQMIVDKWGSPVHCLRVPKADELKAGVIIESADVVEDDTIIDNTSKYTYEEVANVRGLRLGLVV